MQMVDDEKRRQRGARGEHRRSDAQSDPDLSLPRAALEIVEAQSEHRRKQTQLFVFEPFDAFAECCAAHVRRQRFDLADGPVRISRIAHHLREAVFRLALDQHGEYALAPFARNEILHLAQAPSAFEVARRTDRDEPFAFIQRRLDVRAEVGGKRQLLLIAEDLAHFLSAGLLFDRRRNAVRFNRRVQRLRDLLIRRLVTVADKCTVGLPAFHNPPLSGCPAEIC